MIRRRKPEYPEAPAGEDLEVLAGVEFPDPYRWLEQDGDEQVRRWQDQQNELTREWLDPWPHHEALMERVAYHSASKRGVTPRFAGGRWFQRGVPEGGDRPAVQVGSAASGPWETLYDPDREPGDHPRNVEWIAPSPDGQIVAFGVSEGHDESNTIRLVDVETGEPLPDAIPHVLMDGWAGGVHWLADSSGFYYAALDKSTPAYRNVAFFHRLGESAATEPEPLPPEEDYDGWLMVQTDPGGRWAVASMGLFATRPIHVRDLSAGTPWRPLVQGLTGEWMSGAIVGDRYVAITSHGCDRGRLVAVPLEGSGDPSTWEELVSESDLVMRSLRVVGNRFYVVGMVETFARVRVYEADGEFVGELTLPGDGTVNQWPYMFLEQNPAGHPDEFVFAFCSLTRSWGAYRADPVTLEVEELEPPTARLEGAVTELRWAATDDGERVPYHVLRMESTRLDEPRPTLLYAYGGFNSPLPPMYPNGIAAFVEAGGVFVHCVIRGGGELGHRWWATGRLLSKQRGYDDLYTVAEHLIDNRVTRPELLGVFGGSGGGLMCGVAITQRPDLFAVAIPRVPMLDLLGACRHPYGENIVRSEFGDPDDAEQVRHLASFSPYALVREGVSYPALFMEVGESDARAPAWHARKFAARLQAATASDQPILLHSWAGVGHGWATGRDVVVRQVTESVAFLMERLGMVPRPDPRSDGTEDRREQ